MAQYIYKDALVAEIEELLKPVKQRLERDRNDPWDSDIAVYKFGKQLMKNIDTLEVKEVDLEKEIAKYLGDDWVQDTPKEVQLDMIDYAKHFFLNLDLKHGKEKRYEMPRTKPKRALLFLL